ncbi:hypothetical protein LEP1GSC032_2952 [Leptospira interrogans str. 2002000631]|nr:hypothetical protein LEP1GSC027_0477 [Leptospira interrogans str. 2002000624]EKR80867.1 hypothetical protein LEP1GSC099_1998 [Leptospira interrogans str. UI 08452]EMJ84667.1 hypothetical protein LEP1GSC032_2952 [Leptospira interrogans str. 2002000631]EMN94467.1 hypothetical protein LEP1GSC110_1658 [Leptospira interrogans serovar Medanensis str. UT053]
MPFHVNLIESNAKAIEAQGNSVKRFLKLSVSFLLVAQKTQRLTL